MIDEKENDPIRIRGRWQDGEKFFSTDDYSATGPDALQALARKLLAAGLAADRKFELYYKDDNQPINWGTIGEEANGD